MTKCIGLDPLCPCQDGDMCHYEGPNPFPVKGYYWVLTYVHKVLAVRYFSGKHWKFHPSQRDALRPPSTIIKRIEEPCKEDYPV